MGSGTSTQGAAVVSQCRVLDLQARGAKKRETAPVEVIDEALAKLQAMIDCGRRTTRSEKRGGNRNFLTGRP